MCNPMLLLHCYFEWQHRNTLCRSAEHSSFEFFSGNSANIVCSQAILTILPILCEILAANYFSNRKMLKFDLPGGCTCPGGGVPAGGVYLPRACTCLGGVPAPGGVLARGGTCPEGGYLPRYSPPPL